MLVLRNAITRQYWTHMHDYVLNRMKRCISHKVTKRVWRIDSGAYAKVYYVVDTDGHPISWLYLTKRKGWAAWEVSQIWTFPEHRGQRLAESLYKAAINTDGLMLASGNLHTQFSQSMWQGFISRRLFNVWAHDFERLDQTSTIDIEDGELQCELPIYVKLSARNASSDVRLVALRKKPS